MGVAAKKKPTRKMFHATMLVTRTEEWCVEAESAEKRANFLLPVRVTSATVATACKSRSGTYSIERTRRHF